MRLLLAVGVLSCLPLAVAFAAETNPPPVEVPNLPPLPPLTVSAAPVAPAPAPPAPAVPAPVPPALPALAAPAVPPRVPATPGPAKLPYGVEDVLKLTHAQVSEDVVLNYVLNSGTAYNLGVKDIIFLRSQGVSDRVLTTMMNQRNHVAEESAQQAAAQQAIAQAAMPPPAYADPSLAAAPPLYAPGYSEPPPAPEPPPSTVYVIPYSAPVPGYYGGYYPALYGYPGVSVVYQFGRGGYYGGFRGGYRGGYYSFGGRRR